MTATYQYLVLPAQAIYLVSHAPKIFGIACTTNISMLLATVIIGVTFATFSLTCTREIYGVTCSRDLWCCPLCTRAIFRVTLAPEISLVLPLYQRDLCRCLLRNIWCYPCTRAIFDVTPAPVSPLVLLAAWSKAGSVSITWCRQVGRVPNMTRPCMRCSRKIYFRGSKPFNCWCNLHQVDLWYFLHKISLMLFALKCVHH